MRRHMTAPFLAFSLIVMCAGLAFAQPKPESDPKPGIDPKADPRNGQRLAQQWCATCHIVGPEQRRATEGALDFVTIAKKSDFDAARLALFLLNPHPVMPNMALTRKEAADLAAYIATQRK